MTMPRFAPSASVQAAIPTGRPTRISICLHRPNEGAAECQLVKQIIDSCIVIGYDYVLQPDSLPTVPEFPDKRTPLNVMPLGRFNPEKRAFQYCAVRSMDSSDNDRPVSYSSTSSSASSRDSHCSLGSRATLVSSSHLGLGPTPSQEKDAGAIRLELIPAQQLGCHRERENQVNGSFVDKRSSTLKRVDSKGASPLPSLEPTNPKMLYVDRVVQEILDTERTYVEDLRSIVQITGGPRAPVAHGVPITECVPPAAGSLRKEAGVGGDLLHAVTERQHLSLEELGRPLTD
ncbi:PKHG1 protein, partial [Polypterus senegalus]